MSSANAKIKEALNVVSKVLASRFKACYIYPYFSSSLLTMKLVKTDCKTMAVDAGWRCYYNEKFVDQFSVDQIAGVLIHELWHLLRRHHARCKAINAQHVAWNYACDAEINDGIIAAGIALPDGDFAPVTPAALGRMIGKHCPEGLLAEEYYNMIPQEMRDKLQNEEGDGDGEGELGGSCADGKKRSYELGAGDENAPAISEGQADLVRREVARKVKEASKNAGKMPAGWSHWAEGELTPPTVDWRKALSAAVRNTMAQASGMCDYSYKRMARRAACHPKYISPALIRNIPKVSCLVDTSGSMSDDLVKLALAEITGICKSIGHPVMVLACDTEVHAAKNVMSGKQAAQHMKGGGGTDMSHGIQQALERKPRPDVLIVITDMATGWPKEAPSTKVIICAVADGEGPSWAKIVRVKK